MIRIVQLVVLVGVLFGLLEPTTAAETVVQPATHTVRVDPRANLATQTVTFSQQVAREGDRVAQTVETALQVNTTITQAGQQAHASQTAVQRRQQRFVEVLEVVDGNVRRAHVSYPISRLTSTENADPEQEIALPVEKKSYFVTREGKLLQVTDSQGAIPSQEEFEIVITGLKNLGLPNPLIKFLLGRTISVGDRLKLPKEVAEELMGLGDQFGQVERFELELKSLQDIDEQVCAVFAATIEAVGEAANPIRMRAFGQVVLEAKTCRIVSAELTGPLALSVAEHTPQGNFQYAAQGNMRIAVRSQYGHARQ